MILKLLCKTRKNKAAHMRVTAKNYIGGNLPEKLIRIGFDNQTKTYLTFNKQYAVWALSIWRGQTFFLILDDIDMPSWLPSTFFVISDNKLPSSWVAGLFNDEVEIVIGPQFIAGSMENYGKMVDLEPSSLEEFRQAVENESMGLG